MALQVTIIREGNTAVETFRILDENGDALMDELGNFINFR